MSKIIYCDGSSLGNPGRGGYAVVALDTEKKLIWEYGGVQNPATNNQMELASCVAALKIILKSLDKPVSENIPTQKIPPVTYELRFDSKYVLQGVTEWSKNWVKNNWKTSQKKPVLNKELWQEILKLILEIETKSGKKNILKWTHVYGHNNERWNERADEIARSLAGDEKINLRKGETYED